MSEVLAEKTEEYNHSHTFELYPSSAQGSSSSPPHVWGMFSFGFVAGVLGSVGPAPATAGESVPFIWRGQERTSPDREYEDKNEENPPITGISGDDHRGVITFFGDGRMEFVLKDASFGELTIEGELDKFVDAQYVGEGVEEWKQEWEYSVLYQNNIAAIKET
ncbi:hypothetical protein NLJ89_g11146 [Agrocybe chaxingu]|uniref:Uncharacterized protein n=1 Tax=Agrocybe chaxingu TaxID=84603 RepID=A0A9W8JPA1_9AGAR|nr:hypothetical protein NLJ89_g11146 [Agrocybe chaxingu]